MRRHAAAGAGDADDAVAGPAFHPLAAAPVITGSATAAPSTSQASAATTATWVALFERGTTTAAGEAAVRAAGGTVQRTNASLGYAIVRADAGFALRAEAQAALVGAARNRIVGTAPDAARPDRSDVGRLERERDASRTTRSSSGHGRSKRAAEPLADLQWDMRQIGATPEGSYKRERGDEDVLVGIIDTGVDGRHPDVAPNFDAKRSRNFTQDLPDIDNGEDADGDGIGDEPCEAVGCVDPADVDDDGHGTHVASTIGCRSTGWASPASRPTSRSSTSGPGRTAAASSCSRRWTP